MIMPLQNQQFTQPIITSLPQAVWDANKTETTNL